MFMEKISSPLCEMLKTRLPHLTIAFERQALMKSFCLLHIPLRYDQRSKNAPQLDNRITDSCEKNGFVQKAAFKSST